MWGWTFKWIDEVPTASGFDRIGFSNRAILSKIGTLIIFGTILLILWATMSTVLNYYKDVRQVKSILDRIGITQITTKVFLFFYLIYMQVFCGALINWDNLRFINSPANFGANGNLDFDDQINIIFGFIFYGICMMFPVVVYYFMWANKSKILMRRSRREELFRQFIVLNEELLDNVPPIFSYFFVVVMRRAVFSLSAYCFGDP
jgi:hypothetical protein